MEKHRVVTPAGHDIESVRNPADLDRMAADVMPIELHHSATGWRYARLLPFGTGIITALFCQRVPQKSAAVAILERRRAADGC